MVAVSKLLMASSLVGVSSFAQAPIELLGSPVEPSEPRAGSRITFPDTEMYNSMESAEYRGWQGCTNPKYVVQTDQCEQAQCMRDAVAQITDDTTTCDGFRAAGTEINTPQNPGFCNQYGKSKETCVDKYFYPKLGKDFTDVIYPCQYDQDYIGKNGEVGRCYGGPINFMQGCKAEEQIVAEIARIGAGACR